MGLKPSDKWAVPLCWECHAHQHQIGEISFWGNIEVAHNLAKALYAVSQRIEQGREIVRRFLK